MSTKKTTNTPEKISENNLQEVIIQALIEKQGVEISCINLKKINHVLFDYFIICTGNSKPHVETLHDFVQEMTKKELGVRPTFVEGTENSEWIILDYFNVVVHIFQPEARTFYNIENLWNDAEIQHF